jgi:hypothetical protein
MKAAGILVVAATLMAACGAMYDENAARQGENLPAGEHLKTSESALVAKDCSVSIQCADGSSRSCSGTSGACAANGGGHGSVTCNSATYYCPASSCVADGFCDSSCGFDPDCYCSSGKSCTTNSQCGIDGFCSNRRCVCY